MKLSGKNIWVVGASSGIGFELSKALADAGNFVFVTARRKQQLNTLRERHPHSIQDIQADITSSSGLQELGKQLREHTDVLDMVVLCAGTCEYDDGPTLDIDMYRRVFDLNFFAQIECIKLALPMLEKTGGKIVGVSSLASTLPFPRAEAYGSSKAAFEYVLSSLDIDLLDRNISSVIVRPGFVDTPLTQKNDFSMPFICDAKTAAKKIIRGLESNKKVINFPWQMTFSLNLFKPFQNIWRTKVATNFKKAQNL